MLGFSPLEAGLVLWGAITAVLVVLLIYRSMISMKEDQHLFLDSAELRLEQQEQMQIRARLDRLAPYVNILSAGSVFLLAAVALVWSYQQLGNSGLLPH